MHKQIREQIEILRDHVGHEEFDLEFISRHAWHLAQLAEALCVDKQILEPTEPGRPFLKVAGD